MLKLFRAKSSDSVKFKPISEGTYEDIAFTPLLASAKDNLKRRIDLPLKSHAPEKVDPYTIVGIIGKSPATQKRKLPAKEVDKKEAEEEIKRVKFKERNRQNTPTGDANLPAEIKTTRSPTS